jgi:hypothetical protein
MTVSVRAMAPALVAAVCVAAASLTIEAGPAPAKMDYSLPKTTTLGEPAIMTVRLFNSTGVRIVADFGVADQTAFVFLHTPPDGQKLRVTPAFMPASRPRTTRHLLRDTSHTVVIVMDQWLDLSRPGRHTIDVEFHGAVEIEGGAPAALKREARLTIDVKPRDPARLEQRGAEWLKQISTLPPGSDAATAASALACMRDPLAVPYLELAASRTRAPRYIDALRTLNHPDALEALVRLSQAADPDVRAMAERALADKQADFSSPPCASARREPRAPALHFGAAA